MYTCDTHTHTRAHAHTQTHTHTHTHTHIHTHTHTHTHSLTHTHTHTHTPPAFPALPPRPPPPAAAEAGALELAESGWKASCAEVDKCLFGSAKRARTSDTSKCPPGIAPLALRKRVRMQTVRGTPSTYQRNSQKSDP